MTFISSISGFLQVMTLALYLHPLHVSVTDIEYDEKDKMLKIMMRVFIDDLEATLRQHLNQPELDLLAPKNGLTLDQMAGDYFKQRFSIALDNKPQKTVYLGHERESDALIFYIEVNNVKKWKTIQVLNSIITEVFEDQSNLVHVNVREQVRSLRLTRNNTRDKLSFDPGK
jgi:molybdopterin converting factor small subunit